MTRITTKFSKEQQQWILDNRKIYSVRAMARFLGCSHSTVQRFITLSITGGKRRSYAHVTNRKDKHSRMTRYALKKGYSTVSEAFIAIGRRRFLEEFNTYDQS